MSLIASPLTIPHTSKAQGLFSSQTAFKKPTFNNSHSKLSNDSHKYAGFIHPKDIAARQAQPVRILAKTDDRDLIMSEPTKKVKTSKGESERLDQVNNKTSQQSTVKTTKLTIDDVFNTPSEPKPLNNGNFFEESFEDGSSLSFISSHPSIENLDEEVIAGTNAHNGISFAPLNQNLRESTTSFTVQDDIIQRLSYLHQDNMLLNMQNPLMFNPYVQQNVYQPFELLATLPVGFANTGNFMCNVALSMPPNNLNSYIQFQMHNQHLLQLPLNYSDKSINQYVKNSLDNRVNEDGYDSDSYATRSTSVDQAESSSEEKSQKGTSSPYTSNYDLYEEEKGQEHKIVLKKQKVEKIRNQLKTDTNKEKKGRSLNLKLDLNPKQLKVERRLNRLQLLRYQQEDMEEDEEIKKFGISELLSRANSIVQENNETELCQNTTEDLQAAVPELGQVSKRGQRVVLKTVWNPENVQEEMLEKYFQQLAEVLECSVTDQEAALKLLTTFNMDTSLTLETVRGNKEFYSEVFRLKVKRLRRKGL